MIIELDKKTRLDDKKYDYFILIFNYVSIDTFIDWKNWRHCENKWNFYVADQSVDCLKCARGLFPKVKIKRITDIVYLGFYFQF